MKAKKVLTLFLVVAILFYIFIQLLPLWRITTIILGFLIFSIGFYRTTAPLKPFVVRISVTVTLTYISDFILALFIVSIVQSPPTQNNLSKSLSCPRGQTEYDLVVTWVNVSDPIWQRSAQASGCNASNYLTGGGDVDVFQALKYSLRSVTKNLDFIKRIIIVTERPQVPTWLKTDFQDNSIDISVIFHDQFMASGTFPVFNSNPIEYSVHRLWKKGLIKNHCFLLMNDDFLINKKLTSQHFFDSDGRVVAYAYSHLEFPFNLGFVDLPYGLVGSETSSLIDPHVPYPINAKILEREVNRRMDELKEMFQTKCERSYKLMAQFYLESLLNQWNEGLVRMNSPWDSFFDRCPLGLTQISPESNNLMLKWFNPKFVYIESHDAVEENPPFVKFIETYLKENFQQKNSWEL